MQRTLIRAAAAIMNGLVAGIFVGRILPDAGLRRLSGREYVRYHQETDKELRPAMQLIGGVAVAASVVGVIAVRGRRERILAGIALACGVAEVASTLIRNEPLNREIQRWDPADPPEQWADVRDRWMRGHLARTALSLIGFGCSVAAGIADNGTTASAHSG